MRLIHGISVTHSTASLSSRSPKMPQIPGLSKGRHYGVETVGRRTNIASVKSKIVLPAIFIAVFALSRIPGLLPPNFSVAYAFAFCAGAFFPGALAWWLPLATFAVTDFSLNVLYYHGDPFGYYLLVNYGCYALLIGLGKWFGRRASFFKLLGGGLLGAILFYLVTNTFSWLQDTAYAKTIAGWIQALTSGRPDWHPTTWEMFRNTLLSGGLFTALFTWAGQATAESPADKNAGAREPEPKDEPAAEPEEANA